MTAAVVHAAAAVSVVHAAAAHVAIAAAMAATMVHVAVTAPVVHVATSVAMAVEVNVIAVSVKASSRRRVVSADGGTVHVVATKSSVPVRAAVGIVATVVIVPTVSAVVRPPHYGTAVIEVAAVVVAVDGEVPSAGTPYDGAQEVVGSHEEVVLPVVQDVTQIVQPVVIIAAIDVGRGVQSQEVVKVDLVCVVVLLVVQVQLIRHLVRQVESLGPGAFKTHCIGCDEGCH